MADMTPDDLQKIKDLLAQTSSSKNDSDDSNVSQGQALLNTLKQGTSTIGTTDAPGTSPEEQSAAARNPNNIPLPYGGMNPQELASYVARNPGPIATTGDNPAADKAALAAQSSDDSDDDSDEEDSSPTRQPAAPAKPDVDVGDADASGSSTASTSDLDDSDDEDSAPKKPNVFSQQAMQKAQQNANLQKLIGGLGLGIGSEAYNNFMKDNAVTRLQQQQASANDNIKNQLSQYQLANTQQKNDPNHPSSQFARAAVQNVASQIGLKLPPSFNQMSASDIEGNPVLDKMLTSQSNNLTKQMIAEQRLQAQQANQGNKQGQQQNQALQQTTQMLESARGNPAAAQAEKDLYAAQKLNSLVGNGQNLSPQMTQLAASEVAKIATGGVPTSAELEGLNPKTIPSSLAALAQKVQNQPVGADAQAFMKQYQDYANKLSGDAQKVIQDKYGRVIETNKGRLGEDNYKALQDNYINRFKNSSPQSQTRTPQSTGASNQITPDVAAYAQQHGITPAQALAIKNQRLGNQ